MVALLAFQWLRSRGQDSAADKDVVTSHVVDSEHKAEAKASAKVDTVVDTLRIREDHYEKAAKRLIETSDTVGQHAVSLGDTAEMWHLKWKLVGLALDSTAQALAVARLRADSLFADRERWKGVAERSTGTMDALRVDLATARSGCRIIPLIPCLSRKQTAIVAFAAGAFVVWRYRPKG